MGKVLSKGHFSVFFFQCFFTSSDLLVITSSSATALMKILVAKVCFQVHSSHLEHNKSSPLMAEYDHLRSIA